MGRSGRLDREAISSYARSAMYLIRAHGSSGLVSSHRVSLSAQTYDSTSVNLNVVAPNEAPDHMKAFFSWLFGCHHHHVSRVFTLKKRTYQVCFDCGAELAYSWDRMHRTQTSDLRTAHTDTPRDVLYRDSGESIGSPRDSVA